MVVSSAPDSPQRARARNRRAVLHQLRTHGPLTRTQIGAEVGLAKSTVKEICDALLDDGLLAERPAGSAHRGQGRPAQQLAVSSARGHLLAVDVGSDTVVSRVAALDGEELATARRRSSSPTPTRAQVLDAVAETAGSALASAGVARDALLTAVVGTPGVVDPVTRRVALAPQIEGWDGLDVVAELALALSLPPERVTVDRQADLAAIAEGRVGSALGAHSALYVHVGMGVGSALLVDGELHRGFTGAAGEIGYLPHSFGEPVPTGVGFGAWEWATGGHAFARHGRAAALGPSGARLLELAGGDADRVDAALVFAAAGEGDPAATHVTRLLVARLAVGIASVVCVLDPECVVVAGGISRAGQPLLDLLSEHLRPLVPVVPDLRLSAFAGEGPLVGAVHRAADLAFDLLSPV